MTSATRTSNVDRASMCSRITAERACDPIGHALETKHGILIELAKPWTVTRHDSPKMLPALGEVVRAYSERALAAWYEGGVELMTERCLDLVVGYIAPDRDYSKPGLTRVIKFTKPAPPFAVYQRREWLAPDPVVADLVDALTSGAGLTQFDEHVVDEPGIRDIIVCTQGNVDTCCATFGFPIYRQMRAIAAESGGKVRVWEATHFQYHRYAPVALELPAALHWGQLTTDDLRGVVLRDGQIESLRDRYMGWSGAGTDPFAQVAEREAMLREGWDWLSYRKRCEITERAPGGESASVRILFESADGSVSGAYEVEVAVTGSVSLPVGCFNPGEYSEVTQHTVASIKKV